jgi:hypothetical protein
MVMKGMKEEHARGNIAYVFEHGDWGTGALLSGGSMVPHIADKTTTLKKRKPGAIEDYYEFFQACDLVAWLYNEYVHKRSRSRSYQQRPAMTAFKTWRDMRAAVDTERGLIQICEQYPEFFKRNENGASPIGTALRVLRHPGQRGRRA